MLEGDAVGCLYGNHVDLDFQRFATKAPSLTPKWIQSNRKLAERDHQTAWHARYSSASVLYELQRSANANILLQPEHVAWGFS